MKTIFKKILPFVVLFVALNFLFTRYSGFYKQQDNYLERIEKSINNKPEVIFLGDSHTESIKLLDLSDNVGNLAYGADGIKEMYYKILIMLENNKNLKHIFITVEPQMFNNSVSPNSTFLNRYLINISDPLNVYEKSKLNVMTERIPVFNDAFLTYFLEQLFGLLKPNPPKIDKKWIEFSPEEQADMAVKMGEIDHRGIMSNEIDLQVFEEIVRICKIRGIRIIGTHFPVNKNYINQCDPEDLKRVYTYLESQDLDMIVDYTHDFQDQRYYRDQDHLTKEGLTILAEYIYKDTGINILK